MTHTDIPDVRPDEGRARIISRRPSWADTTTVSNETITHSWTAPTSAKVMQHDGTLRDVTVEMYRDDDLLEHDGVVALHEGEWRILVLDDVAIGDTVNARRFAQAIVECCDRIDGASS